MIFRNESRPPAIDPSSEYYIGTDREPAFKNTVMAEKAEFYSHAPKKEVNFTRKRKRMDDKQVYIDQRYDKTWLKDMDYEEARFANDSVYRVYKQTGSVVQMNSKRVQVKDA